MNEDNRELLDGLRELAADGPREAPRYIEERLKLEFRKQNRRRSLLTWVPVFSMAAAIALLLWIRSEAPRPAPARATAAAHAIAPVAEEESDGFIHCRKPKRYPPLRTRWWSEFNCRFRPCS